MGVSYNPKVTTDGLILSYDMNNTSKSWLGKPTTNMIPDMSLVTVQAAPYLTYIGVENGWKKYSLTGTWAAGTYPYSIAITGTSFTGNTTYSSSVQLKTSCLNKFEYFATGMNYVNQPMNLGGTSFYTQQPDGSRVVGRYGFQYVSTSTQNGYILSKPLANGTVFNPTTDFVYLKNGQVEQSDFCTPYTPGTRTTANALIDLTGTNTLTIQSLTYNANNTFTFNGTTDYINPPTIPQAIGTVISWVRPSAVAGDYVIFGPDSNGQDNWIGINGGKVYLLYTQYSDIDNTAIIGNTPLSINTWYQIACTVSGNVAKVYLNGVEDGTSTAAFIIGYWTGTSAIGRRGATGTRYFPGNISNFQLYSRVLTPTEIKQNFNAFRGRYGL